MTRKHLYWIGSLAAVVVLGLAAAALTSDITSAGGSNGPAAGRIDDGADLLPQASITLDEAIAAAQGAADGDLGEVDLEYFEDRLVFNVDVGDKDVKVDAESGAVLGAVSDD